MDSSVPLAFKVGEKDILDSTITLQSLKIQLYLNPSSEIVGWYSVSQKKENQSDLLKIHNQIRAYMSDEADCILWTLGLDVALISGMRHS